MRQILEQLDPAWVLSGAAFMLLPLAVLFPLGIAPLAGFCAGLVFAHAVAVGRLRPVANMTLVILIFAFLVWGGLSALWSLSPERTIETLLRLAAIAAGALFLLDAANRLDEAGRRIVLNGLIAGAACGGVLLGFELITGELITSALNIDSTSESVTRLNRASSVSVILVWAIAIVLRRRFGAVAAAVSIALCMVAVLYVEPQAARLAIAAGAAMFLFALWRARLAATILAVAFVGAVAASPFLQELAPRADAKLSAVGINNNSISHRLSIWQFASTKIADKPLGGWGLGTVRLIPGGQENVSVLGRAGERAPAIPLHPHSGLLQIWVETGPPGALIASAIVVLLIVAVPGVTTGRFDPAATLAMVTSALTIIETSYGIWQGWWQSALWLMAVLMVVVVRSIRDDVAASLPACDSLDASADR